MLNKILWTVDFTPPDPPELKGYALMIRKLYEQLARAFNAMVDVVNACNCGGGGGAVTSIFGRTGVVIAEPGDYSVSQVTGAAPLASPALTGNPTAPTQTFGDNTTKIATDAFVQAAIAGASAPVTSVFGRTGAVVAVTNDYSVAQVNGAAPLASPTFTGVPLSTTPATVDNSTKIATTAYVQNQGYVTSVTSPVTSVFGRVGAVVAATNDYTQSQIAAGAIANGSTATTQTALDASTKVATDAYVDSAVGVEKSRALAAEALLAPLASPALTGSPTAPTQTFGDNSTLIATDAFVQAAVAGVISPVTSVFGRTGAVVATLNDYSFSLISGQLAQAQLPSAIDLGSY